MFRSLLQIKKFISRQRVLPSPEQRFIQAEGVNGYPLISTHWTGWFRFLPTPIQTITHGICQDPAFWPFTHERHRLWTPRSVGQINQWDEGSFILMMVQVICLMNDIIPVKIYAQFNQFTCAGFESRYIFFLPVVNIVRLPCDFQNT